ncbi:hypothetical protein I7X12_18545 [Halosimplex litoreum]|uniref:Uncharacterized protein n=1 Tax=Halosimplex litoreum TaxID=1198301 RepID=A0A7T3FXZ0_9EURY|nr:hypothetical protein [Halosimplex litoreum]QPV62701.1 hypothetical protein I7X12_18545 [Halosimplex litoreum]
MTSEMTAYVADEYGDPDVFTEWTVEDPAGAGGAGSPLDPRNGTVVRP